MKDEPIEDLPLEHLGPAMRALVPTQRRFVIGYLANGGKNACRVARAAGYKDGSSLKVTVSRMLDQPKVIAALKEEADRRFIGIAGVKARLRIETLIDSKDEKIALAATDSTLDRTGLGRATKQDIHVTREDERTTEDLVRLVQQYAPKLLEKPIEGEFTVVESGEKTTA